MKINILRKFYAFRLKMHVRYDNQYKTGTDGGTILGQLTLFERAALSDRARVQIRLQ